MKYLVLFFLASVNSEDVLSSNVSEGRDQKYVLGNHLLATGLKKAIFSLEEKTFSKLNQCPFKLKFGKLSSYDVKQVFLKKIEVHADSQGPRASAAIKISNLTTTIDGVASSCTTQYNLNASLGVSLFRLNIFFRKNDNSSGFVPRIRDIYAHNFQLKFGFGTKKQLDIKLGLVDVHEDFRKSMLQEIIELLES